jgi:hypothetical protein
VGVDDLMKLYGMKSEFDFGQYNGETVEEILELDPQYVLWCINNVEYFNPTKSVKEEAVAEGSYCEPDDGDYDDADNWFFWEEEQNF